MTELLNVEFEDETGTTRRLTRNELLAYAGLVAGAGDETTARLIGSMGKVLAEHPEQRRQLGRVWQRFWMLCPRLESCRGFSCSPMLSGR